MLNVPWKPIASCLKKRIVRCIWGSLKRGCYCQGPFVHPWRWGCSCPKGLGIWNARPSDTIFDVDHAPREELRSIRIVGARNGAFFGKIVVGSDKPIRGLKVEASDLKSDKGGGTIPSAAATIKYAQPGTSCAGQIASGKHDVWSERPSYLPGRRAGGRQRTLEPSPAGRVAKGNYFPSALTEPDLWATHPALQSTIP